MVYVSVVIIFPNAFSAFLGIKEKIEARKRERENNLRR